jgi:hypothetical protein
MFCALVFTQVCDLGSFLSETNMMIGCRYDQAEAWDTLLSGSLRLKIEVDDFAFMFGHKSI